MVLIAQWKAVCFLEMLTRPWDLVKSYNLPTSCATTPKEIQLSLSN